MSKTSNLDVAKQTVLTAETVHNDAHCRTIFSLHSCQPLVCCMFSWQNGAARHVAQTRILRTESKVPAPPARPCPPNVTTSQMFCNVVCPAIDQALVSRAGPASRAPALPTPTQAPQPACDLKGMNNDLYISVYVSSLVLPAMRSHSILVGRHMSLHN
jgi:hypothetical protein